MNREALTHLAEEAQLLSKRTRHLTEIGHPIHSLALELCAEKHKDPLRQLLKDQHK